jgi:hypothetical protein
MHPFSETTKVRRFQTFLNPKSTMEVLEPDIAIHGRYPRRVKSVIASSSNYFIGVIDENTVLKYPPLPSEKPPGLCLRKREDVKYLEAGTAHWY